MDNDNPPRRRRRAVFGSSLADSTDGIGTSFIEPEDDLADSVVDINKLVEQRNSSTDPTSVPETSLDVYDKETRLRYIHKLRMRDTPKEEICKKIGITKAQLEKDTKELYSRLREGARSLDVNELIGDSIAVYQEVLANALRHASNLKLPVPTRLAALRTVLSARNDMARFLTAAGVFDVAVYRQKEQKSEQDIGSLIKATQALLDKDEVSETHEVTPEQRVEVEKELQQVRLF